MARLNVQQFEHREDGARLGVRLAAADGDRGVHASLRPIIWAQEIIPGHSPEGLVQKGLGHKVDFRPLGLAASGFPPR